MPNFNLQFYHRNEFPVVTNGEDRFYQTRDGTYPSVTTILSYAKDKTFLDKWRKRIGNEEADAIRYQSNVKGKLIHSLCENYLSNKEWQKGVAAVNLDSFLPIQKILDENVLNVYGLELLVWSKKLKIAGRTDALVAYKDGVKHILDFKTSKRLVDETSEKAYFFKMQATLYAMLAEETYSSSVPYSTVIVVQNNSQPLVLSFLNEEMRKEAAELTKKIPEVFPPG